MILNAIIDEQVYTLNVPDPVIERGAEFFDQLDRDMDQGWQMSREWVEAPDRLQRCQIIADKLLTALEKENEKLGMLMAGYILSRLPQVESVELDLQGEIQNNQFRFSEAPGLDDAGARQTTPHEKPASPAASNGATETGAASGAGGGAAAAAAAAAHSDLPSGLNKMQAMAQAGQDVTQVFKVGKAYRFSVMDHASGNWQDSPLIATEAEAERLRQQAFKARYEALQQP
ncbi:hypothetical protein CKO42_10560 [Lamprobacter modestohalophilus]|uniref:Uncharacterized protein n=1 Tax=Lamprobacter modestohalophilus TaxID=1064514 RepID=A0A9X0W8Q1_9GAMM|nr:hypothetical protein [Lamprobacter modestohalophilus]MBK1618866.1 hypothetical protein [Lamprobacter modestohalophilus]